MQTVTRQLKKISGRGRPTFYSEIVMNDKGLQLLTDAWNKNTKGYFVILTYWHQINDPYVTPKKVVTLAEVVICPITLRRLKSLEANQDKETLFHIRRVDLEGYDGWDRFDYD